MCVFLSVLGITLSACGNAVFTDVSGRVGFSLNEAGGIVINVESCGAELDSVGLSGPNPGDGGENHRYAQFVASEPVSGYFTVDISHPGPNWQKKLLVEVPENADELLIGHASSVHEDIEAYPVDAKLSEIRALKPGEILVGSSESEFEEVSTKIVTLEEFSRCG
ncbi:MAG: hypothetical protein SOW59_08275 [Corynebacterium sp.]|nr:hypothetical protein [Corynebacterium sp.]